MEKKKIFVGLSGGVDSAVSVALLQEAGHDVVGVFIKVWQADFLPCTWREERREAMRVAAHLRIPFLTLDLEQEYKDEVVDYMIREYGAGRVPNPDVMCNKHVKFGAFLDYALAHGADAIATGHYARIQESGVSIQASGNAKENSQNQYRLFAGVDKEKDQSYFLWTLTQAQLARTVFPVGGLQKKEVRELAVKFGLPNAEKKDSQGLCFMGAVDMPEFLKHYLRTKRGNVLNEHGEIVGDHDGAILYTIGQRHGFSTIKSTPHEAPYIVIAKDITKNTLTVSHKDLSHEDSPTQTISVTDLNNISGSNMLRAEEEMTARIRYRGALHLVTRICDVENPDRVTVQFHTPIDSVTPGQSIVFYRSGECLGGGIISE